MAVTHLAIVAVMGVEEVVGISAKVVECWWSHTVYLKVCIQENQICKFDLRL